MTGMIAVMTVGTILGTTQATMDPEIIMEIVSAKIVGAKSGLTHSPQPTTTTLIILNRRVGTGENGLAGQKQPPPLTMKMTSRYERPRFGKNHIAIIRQQCGPRVKQSGLNERQLLRPMISRLEILRPKRLLAGTLNNLR